MSNLCAQQDIWKERLENQCMIIIEKELEIFFASCKKSAYAYSVLAAQDLHNYRYEAFERMVLSRKEIEELMQQILMQIDDELEKQMEGAKLSCSCIDIENCGNVESVLKDTVKSFQITQNIVKVCEKMINTGASKVLKNIWPNPITGQVAKKVNLGEKLLGEYSLKNQIQRHQEQIYKQIEGVLINTKVSIRNQLVEVVIKGLQQLTEKQAIYHYAIA